MSASTELAGLVRRLSPEAYERVLLLLHCLLAGSSDSLSDGGVAGGLVSLQAVCEVVLCACPGPVPRFAFALSNNDKLLRSVDGGRTWRLSFSRSGDHHAEAPPPPRDLLDDVASLLKASADTDAAAGGEGVDAAVCCADGYGDVVALCGRNGFLAVSGDRGVTFTSAANYLSRHLGENARLRHVCVLDSERLLVSDDSRVVRVGMRGAGSNSVALGEASVVLQCATPVCMMRACSLGGAARVVIVAESGALHLSHDGAASFLEVRHCLGRIRDVGSTAAMRRSELPTFPLDAVVSSMEPAGSDVAAAAQQSGAAYEYVSGYTCTAARGSDTATAAAHFARQALRYGPDVHCHHLLVVGSGTAVMAYDYSALLRVCTRSVGGRLVVLSSATHVSYVPFSHTRGYGRLLSASVRSSSGYLVARGSSVGSSVSSDFDHWTLPQGGAPAGLWPVGGGGVVACGCNKVVARVGGGAAEVHTVPSDMRVPLLLWAFSM